MDTPELWWGSIRKQPRHLSNLAIRLFGIIVTQASCERNFSTLRWMIGDYRTRLDVQKLEGMSKIRSYYLTNIKKELKYYGKEFNIGDLKEITNDSTVGNIVDLNGEESFLDINDDNFDSNSHRNTLILEDIIDLSLPIFDNDIFNDNINISDTNNENNINTSNFNYDPEALVNAFIEQENNNV
jgi:hAT family protein